MNIVVERYLCGFGAVRYLARLADGRGGWVMESKDKPLLEEGATSEEARSNLIARLSAMGR